MLTQLFHGKFFKHLLGSSLILVIVMVAYDLLTFFIPLVKLSFTCGLIFLAVIDIILIVLKLLTIRTNQQFRP
ncbi:hypothetical protein [Limosilactobacillus caccae]|uniref:hypothetical protein n=1 Tax=Limosilactobacillus caccae TaxID=1926284 RepID=UPI000970E07F|nr:hypothetical protein [Limosilactobacillus caccae]